MAADDKFIKAGYGTATTLSAPGYTSGVSTTINVASTATWPTTTDVIFAIDEAEVVDGEEQRVDGTYNVFQGTVDTATSIIDVDYIGGDAERSYSAGALTRVYILSSSYLWNRAIDGLLVSHDQDGTLKAGAVDNAAVLADNVVTTAKINNGAVTNAKLSTTAGEIGAAWQSWTPNWTNFTPGSATINAYYKQIGKTVHFRLQVTLSGSTMGTDPQFSLPVTASSSEQLDRTLGIVHLKDASPGADNAGVCYLNSTTTAGIVRLVVSGSSLTYSVVTSTAPWTWANSDTFYARGTYEAA